MNVIRTKTPLPIPGLRALKRWYVAYRLRHAEADAAAFEGMAKLARLEAQRLRVEQSDLTN